MSVTDGEHVLILTDRSTLEVGRAIAKAAEKVTERNVKLQVLEDYVKHPATELPEAIARETDCSLRLGGSTQPQCGRPVVCVSCHSLNGSSMLHR
jgi:hypothetical protein